MRPSEILREVDRQLGRAPANDPRLKPKLSVIKSGSRTFEAIDSLLDRLGDSDRAHRVRTRNNREK